MESPTIMIYILGILAGCAAIGLMMKMSFEFWTNPGFATLKISPEFRNKPVGSEKTNTPVKEQNIIPDVPNTTSEESIILDFIEAGIREAEKTNLKTVETTPEGQNVISNVTSEPQNETESTPAKPAYPNLSGMAPPMSTMLTELQRGDALIPQIPSEFKPELSLVINGALWIKYASTKSDSEPGFVLNEKFWSISERESGWFNTKDIKSEVRNTKARLEYLEKLMRLRGLKEEKKPREVTKLKALARRSARDRS